MRDQDAEGTAGSPDGTPCWCTLLPPAVPVPRQDAPATPETPAGAGCWCPECLKAHIAALQRRS
ncbi:hypothetical protein GCM10007386_13350 [Pseudoduganella dura]|nr:hypothetical protein GCM10007386_13350 [Pseudoduganella dura]